ncbi:MAG TPA: hypothetical protein VN256_27005 [Pyrinomonadaceae bacterium]|nr:hypothetical protein [Pyrinomonadaceae bacterium]
MNNQHGRPLGVGLRAARANLIPALVIQIIVVAIVAAYYFHPPAREWLAHLAELKRRGGYLFSFAAGALAGGMMPQLLKVAVFEKWRVRRENLNEIVFGVCFWGLMGVMVDGVYRAQAWMFGTQVDFVTVFKKTLVDQFVFTPFVSIPLTVVILEWKHQGYRLAGLSRVFSLRFYKQKILPTVVSALGFWLPVVILIYCLPPLLQFPLFTLALTLWVMIITWISLAQKEGMRDEG